MTRLIYCADGNPRFAQIAIEQGFTYGAQLPNSIAFQPQFVDQNWRNPNREKYMAALKQYKPALATVLDWERDEQLSEVLSWATEAAQYVSESVIVIPKVMGGIPRIPEVIGNVPVRLGYSVPTKFAGTELPLWQFGAYPVHLLGGSPNKQIELRNYLNVQSVDGNYSQLMAVRYGQFYACNKMARAKHPQWPRLSEVSPVENDVPYHAFRLSCINIRLAWQNCRFYIRYGTESDVPEIKKIASQYKTQLGFVNSASLKESAHKYTLFVAEYMGQVIGFVNTYHRRDGWNTIYEIAVHRDFRGRGVGRGLLEAVPTPRRLKCTIENPANLFYESMGMTMVRREQGKKRPLNVWERFAA